MLEPDPTDEPRRATFGTYASIAGLAIVGLALLAFGALLVYGTVTLTQTLANPTRGRPPAVPLPLGGIVSAGLGLIFLYFAAKFTRNIIRTGNWDDPDN